MARGKVDIHNLPDYSKFQYGGKVIPPTILISVINKRKFPKTGQGYERLGWTNHSVAETKFNKTFGLKYKFVDAVCNTFNINTYDIPIDYTARLSCQMCGKWQRSYSCPPYTPSIEKARRIIRSYKKACVMVYKTDGRINWKHDEQELFHFHSRYEMGLKGIAFGLQVLIDKEVVEIRRQLRKKGYKVKGFVSGKCSLCRKCEIENDKPCKHEGKIMASPEAWGVNLYRLMEDLKIGYEHPVKSCLTMLSFFLYNKRS